MSANPEAFDYLRQIAYRFVQKHGKDYQRLHEHCRMSLAEWRSGSIGDSGLSDAEAARLVEAVTSWTVARYNPPVKKAERSREERAATELGSPALLELAEETFGKGTIRNAARVGGQSKSTTARHLRQQGIAPKRMKKIDALPARLKKLVTIMDATFPRDGAGLVLTDHLAAALWDGIVQPSPATARSTRSTRRRKLKDYAQSVNDAGVGLNVVIYDDVVAVRRGKRFKGPKDTATWIAEERRRRGIRATALPDVVPAASELFWSDPWVSDFVAVLRIGTWNDYLVEPEHLAPFIRLSRPVLDTQPLYKLVGLAIGMNAGNGFSECLGNLCDRVRDPELRKAAILTADRLDRLLTWAHYDRSYAYFQYVDRDLGFMERARFVAPASFARLRYLSEELLASWDDELEDEEDRIIKTVNRCKELGEMERQGKWQPPEKIDLYHPRNDPPF